MDTMVPGAKLGLPTAWCWSVIRWPEQGYITHHGYVWCAEAISGGNNVHWCRMQVLWYGTAACWRVRESGVCRILVWSTCRPGPRASSRPGTTMQMGLVTLPVSAHPGPLLVRAWSELFTFGDCGHQPSWSWAYFEKKAYQNKGAHGNTSSSSLSNFVEIIVFH